MKGRYVPFNDGYGIVGFGYVCPECNHESEFTTCEEGCEECEFSEPYVDPDDWYVDQMDKLLNK